MNRVPTELEKVQQAAELREGLAVHLEHIRSGRSTRDAELQLAIREALRKQADNAHRAVHGLEPRTCDSPDAGSGPSTAQEG